MPAVTELVKRLFEKEPSKDINPDECVALGAAVQGAVLSGEVKNVVLVDVTPLTLGIETLGGVMTKLIQRNTAIPAKRKETFTTAADMQTSVEVHVLQGEREFAKDNKSLGTFILRDLPPAPRGVPQIEVEFNLDSNGILNVEAKDKASGKTQRITITASTNLSKSDVENMVKDAESFAADDKKRRDQVELKNQADSLVYQSEKTVKEFGDKITGDAKAKIEEAQEKLRKLIENDNFNTEEVKAAIEELQQAVMAASSAMYGQEGEGEGQPEGQQGPVDGEVVDAEFEVKD